MTVRQDKLGITVDQHDLAATLASPSATVPGVLFVHGWGGSQERDLARAHQIASLGCVCLTFDLLGHAATSSQRETVTREQNLRDLVAAYDTLVSQPSVQDSAVAVVGSSYGGYLAAVLSTIRPVKWLALRVPALYEDADWHTPKMKLDRQVLMAYRRGQVDIDENRALRACAEFQGDVLIVESEHDDLVPHQTILSYISAFRRAHSLTHRIIDGADHALSSEACERAYTWQLVNWAMEMVLGARGETPTR